MVVYINFINLRSFNFSHYFDGAIQHVPVKDYPLLHLVFLKLIYVVLSCFYKILLI